MKREFTCVPLSASAVRSFVGNCLDRLRASDETRFEVLVAVTEAVANVVRHAPSTGRFEVDCVSEGRSVVVTVRDRGPGFPSESKAKWGEIPELYDSGRRGLYLIRELMDVVVLDTSTSGTTLAMKRRLAS